MRVRFTRPFVLGDADIQGIIQGFSCGPETIPYCSDTYCSSGYECSGFGGCVSAGTYCTGVYCTDDYEVDEVIEELGPGLFEFQVVDLIEVPTAVERGGLLAYLEAGSRRFFSWVRSPFRKSREVDQG